MFGGYVQGQHIAARRDLHSWGHHVRRGTRGVVVSQSGLFDTRYVVNFESGGQMTVRSRDIKSTLLGPGSDWAAGVKLGLFVFMIVIPAIGVARYLLAGGSISGLIAAAPAGLIAMAIGLFSRVVGLVGVPALLIILTALWVWSRHRRRT